MLSLIILSCSWFSLILASFSHSPPRILHIFFLNNLNKPLELVKFWWCLNWKLQSMLLLICFVFWFILLFVCVVYQRKKEEIRWAINVFDVNKNSTSSTMINNSFAHLLDALIFIAECFVENHGKFTKRSCSTWHLITSIEWVDFCCCSFMYNLHIARVVLTTNDEHFVPTYIIMLYYCNFVVAEASCVCQHFPHEMWFQLKTKTKSLWLIILTKIPKKKKTLNLFEFSYTLIKLTLCRWLYSFSSFSFTSPFMCSTNVVCAVRKMI